MKLEHVVELAFNHMADAASVEKVPVSGKSLMK